MIRRIIFILISIFIYQRTQAQMLSNIETIEAGGSLSQYNMIGKKPPAPEVRGDYFLFENWEKADIILKENKSINGQQVNINLQSGDIEIVHEGVIRLLSKERIKSMTIDNRKFVNAIELNYPEGSNTFFECIEDGEISIYINHYITLREPTYVPGLAVGDKNYKVLKKMNYYVYKSSSLATFRKDRNVNLNYFENSPDTKQFIKNEKLHLNKAEDFIQAVKFYNGKYHK